MPTAQNDRKIGIPCLDGARNFHRLPNHRPGNERNTKAQRIAHFLEYSLGVIGRDRGIDNADLVSGAKQRCGDRQDTQRSGRIRTGKRGKEEDYFFGSRHYRSCFTRTIVLPALRGCHVDVSALSLLTISLHLPEPLERRHATVIVLSLLTVCLFEKASGA